MEVKKIAYGPGAYVEYAVKEGIVFFCVVTNIREVAATFSVVTAVKNIINCIEADMNLLKPMRWCALLTHVNWDCKCGEYDFREIDFFPVAKNRSEVNWIVRPCPPEIVELFLKNIGGTNPRPIQHETRRPLSDL